MNLALWEWWRSMCHSYIVHGKKGTQEEDLDIQIPTVYFFKSGKNWQSYVNLIFWHWYFFSLDKNSWNLDLLNKVTPLPSHTFDIIIIAKSINGNWEGAC